MTTDASRDSAPAPDGPAPQLSPPKMSLTPAQLARVEQALATVGTFGEVRLLVRNGRLRAIQTVYCEGVNEQDGSSTLTDPK